MSRIAGTRARGQSFAIVVFMDSGIGYLRVLKAGYRHCLVVVQDGGTWIALDPLSNGTDIRNLGPARPCDLLAALGASGLDAVPVQRAAPVLRELPWAPYTCVEAVKRAIGLRARRVVTPWQLRRHLTRPRTAA